MFIETMMDTIVYRQFKFSHQPTIKQVNISRLDHAGLYQDGLVTKPRFMGIKLVIYIMYLPDMNTTPPKLPQW